MSIIRQIICTSMATEVNSSISAAAVVNQVHIAQKTYELPKSSGKGPNEYDVIFLTRLSSQALDTSQVVNKEDPQVAHWAKNRTIEQ